MTSATIKKENGKWFLNGKLYHELNESEKLFFDEFWIAIKFNFKNISIKEVQDRATDKIVKEIQNHQFKKTNEWGQ